MKKRKGFTLVELLVVIAIVAVLATVSVVGYLGFTKQAKESNDISLTTQMNTILQANEVKDGKNETAYDAVSDLVDGGLDVTKLTPTTNNYSYIWDSNIDRMILVDENYNVVAKDSSKAKSTNTLDLFAFVGNDSEYEKAVSNKTSIYLKNGYTPTAKLESVNVGLDVGDNSNISTIKYANENEQSVIIRTNGGDLYVNAENDTIKHYGNSNSVKIEAVAGESYHEYGNVIGINLLNGRVVIEDSSEVKLIVVNQAESKTAKVVVPENNNIKIFAPDTVEVIGGKSIGVINANDFDKAIKGEKDFSGGIGTKEYPYLISKCEHALKINDYNGYFKLIDDIVVPNEIYMSAKTFVIDLNGHSITLKYAENVKPNNGSVLYIGGNKGNLTINDSSSSKTGKVIGSSETFKDKVTSAVRVGNYGKLTINGGNFYGKSEGTSCIFVYTSQRSPATKATVIINGGYFETSSPFKNIYYVLNHEDDTTNSCKITVNGGTFKNYNPGVTEVDPDNSFTGKIELGKDCTTSENVDGNDIYYIVSKQ